MGKNNHYVPQFYLRLFSNDLRKRSVGAYIFGANKFVKTASIANMAQKDYLYGKDQELENILIGLEGIWSKAINKLIVCGIDNICDETKLNILYFIALSKTRTLKQAQQENYQTDYFAKMKLTSIGVENIKGSFKREIPNLDHMYVAVKNIELFTDLQWLMLENTTDAYFITSDTPVCMYNKLYVVRSYDRGYGVGSGGIIIFVPINPQKCLCLFDSVAYEPINRTIIKIDTASKAHNINKLLCRNAYNNVFYNNKQKKSYLDKYIVMHKAYSIDNFVKPLVEPIYQIGDDNIRENFNLDFLRVRKEFLTVELPYTLGGLLRPIVNKVLNSKSELKDEIK